ASRTGRSGVRGTADIRPTTTEHPAPRSGGGNRSGPTQSMVRSGSAGNFSVKSYSHREKDRASAGAAEDQGRNCSHCLPGGGGRKSPRRRGRSAAHSWRELATERREPERCCAEQQAARDSRVEGLNGRLDHPPKKTARGSRTPFPGRLKKCS